MPEKRLTPLTQNTYGPRLQCRICGEDQKLNYRPKVDAFIRGDPVFCDRCHGIFDLWGTVCGILERRESASHVLGLVECESVVRGGLLSFIDDEDWIEHRRINISFPKLLDGTHAILLKDGDPAVLRMDWRTSHSANPADPFVGQFVVAGSSTIPSRLAASEVVLEMWPKDADVGGVWFEYTVVWVDRASEWRLVHLADAFSAFLDGCFDAAVLPAAVAVETAVHEVLDVASAGGSEAQRALAPSRATSNALVNELLPKLAGLTGYPPLPHVITDELQNLRQYRNNVAHSGRLDRDRRGRLKQLPDLAAQARMLTAALIAVEYTQLVDTPREPLPDR